MSLNPDKKSQKTQEAPVQTDDSQSEIVDRRFNQHKMRLLRATYLYSNLNYSKLVSEEIMRHDRDENINEKVFLKNKALTRETLSQLFKIKLKQPIERYLELKRPLNEEGLLADITRYGRTFFKGSKVSFSKIQSQIEEFVLPLKKKKTILKHLAILKVENQKKYKDMLVTGLLNYVIESKCSEDTKRLETVFLSGLFHDIGFLFLDPKFNDRSSTNFTINDLKKVQAHTQLGYHVLKSEFGSQIANASMNHHIGEDNSGYPRKIFAPPDRISKLTGFNSAFLACLRKHSLTNALKIQDIYSRDKSYFGEKLVPFFKREFYDILVQLDLQYNKEGENVEIKFNRKYSVVLHNFLVYILDLVHELKKIDQLLLNYSWKKSNRLELQNDIDDVFDHINKLFIIMRSCGKSPGLRVIMKDNIMASKILGDIEIISMELHRNNHFLSGLFSFLNTKSDDFTFENSVFKKSLEFSDNIKRNISDQLEKEVSVFNMLSSISG